MFSGAGGIGADPAQSSLLVRLIRVGNEATELDTLAREALAVLVQAFGAKRATLRLGSEGRLRLVAQHPSLLEPDAPVPDDEELSSRAVRQRTLVVEPVARWPGELRAVAPLFAADRGVGTVCLLHGESAPLGEEALRLFELSAVYLAQAIEQVRRVEELQRRVERERLAALGELAAVVAHEVRNPLAVIFNSLTALRRMLQPSGDAEQLFEIVDEECEQLTTLIGEMLDFARPRPVVRISANLAEALEELLRKAEPACRAGGVEVTVDTHLAPPYVPVDERMLRQALSKLILNALQAMPHGGRLTVRALEEAGVEGPPLLRIEVQDSGPGISPALMENIFQPFFTTRAAGSGLGLALVKQIALAHGGSVDVETTPGKGSCFLLRLPLVPP